jgi:hypothetical protein
MKNTQSSPNPSKLKKPLAKDALKTSPIKASVKKVKVNGHGVAHGHNTEWDLLNHSSKNEIDLLVDVLKAVKNGNFSVRLPYEKGGILTGAGELINDIISLNEHMAHEFLRVGKIVGQEGRMTERASVGPAKGSWADSVH